MKNRFEDTPDGRAQWNALMRLDSQIRVKTTKAAEHHEDPERASRLYTNLYLALAARALDPDGPPLRVGEERAVAKRILCEIMRSLTAEERARVFGHPEFAKVLEPESNVRGLRGGQDAGRVFTAGERGR